MGAYVNRTSMAERSWWQITPDGKSRSNSLFEYIVIADGTGIERTLHALGRARDKDGLSDLAVT
jgi:hypothetical protein